MKKLFALLILVPVLWSCEPEGRVFSENKDLSAQLQWLKKDAIEFKIPVDDISSAYDMGLTFRFSEGYQFKVLKVKITETSPSGNLLVNEYELKIREENGDYIGEAALDIWDSEHQIETGKKYEEKGTYTYSIEHNMPSDPVHFAMEIGVILDKAE